MTSSVRTFLRGGALALLAFLGACSIIPEPPPAPRIYPLRAAVQPSADAPAAMVIAVPEPTVSNVLAGEDIVWMRDGILGYMERGVWSSRTPIALQALVIETIDGQNLVMAAIRSGEGPRADAELRWQVTDFQVEERGDRLVARFGADLKLMNGRTRTVYAATRISEEAPIPQRSATAAARVLQTLAQRNAAKIGEWAANAAMIERAQVQRPGEVDAQPKAASTSK